MTPVLVDANVILDVATRDPVWSPWSDAALERAADEAVLVINPIIYAEVSIGFDAIEALEAALPADLYRRDGLPYEAAFLCGKVYLAYRRGGGTRRSPLPDFYIGAHAAVAGYRLLTRDAARYRTYFPTLEFIAPERAESAAEAGIAKHVPSGQGDRTFGLAGSSNGPGDSIADISEEEQLRGMGQR